MYVNEQTPITVTRPGTDVNHYKLILLSQNISKPIGSKSSTGMTEEWGIRYMFDMQSNYYGIKNFK